MLTAYRPNKKFRFPHIECNRIVDVALGNMTQYQVYLNPQVHGTVVIGLIGRGFAEFDFGYQHWTYVAEALGLSNESDARNFADFLNDQFSDEYGECEKRQGNYPYDHLLNA